MKSGQCRVDRGVLRTPMHCFLLGGCGAHRRSRVVKLVASCGLCTCARRATTATRGPVKDLLYRRRPATGDLQLAFAARSPDTCCESSALAPSKRPRHTQQARSGQPAGTIFFGQLLYSKRRVEPCGCQACGLSARATSRAQVEGAAIAVALPEPPAKSSPQRAIKEQQFPITSEPFRNCRCF